MKKLFIPLLLLSATIGCQKESIFNDGIIENSVPLIEEIGGKGTYKYGYIGVGQPTTFQNEDGHIESIGYKFEVYTDTKWNVGDDVKGSLCQCDSVITLNETINR